MPFIEYSATATENFEKDFTALSNRLQTCSDGSYYTARAGALLASALSAVTTGFVLNSGNQTVISAATSLSTGIAILSMVITGVFSAVSDRTSPEYKTLRSTGIQEGFFKTVPTMPGSDENVSQVAEASATNAVRLQMGRSA